VQQWWRTRDQGDSLAVAPRLADIVGVDYYPRHAMVGLGPLTVYLDGDGGILPRLLRRQLFARARKAERRVMVSEGQAEPWESVTSPPNPPGRAPWSCPPEQLIANYNACLRWPYQHGARLDAYLFWGAEYWVLRQQSGDPNYLQAFARILEAA